MSLFNYDQSLPLDIKAVNEPQDHEGVTVSDITFSNAKGGQVAAYLVEPPEKMTAPHPAVLWVHWYETHAQDSNRTQFLDEAITLAKEGVVSVLPDAFWHITPKEWAQNPKYPWKTEFEHDRDLSIRQTIELRRALDVLFSREDVDKDRVVFVGHDFGAMYGALVLGTEHRVKAAVLMAGTTTFWEWFLFGSKLDKEAEKAYREAMSALDPQKFVAKAAPVELLFQFAHSDYYVPERTAQMFFDAASEPKTLKWYEAQHDLKDTDNESGKDRLAWIRDKLGL